MIKFINIITQIIIILGCCAISIFILFVLITFIKNVDDFTAITNIQETFECFTEAIEENPKIDLIKYINQEIGEIGDTQHRIILRYDNEFIPVVKNIITDFNLTNNIKS